MRTSLRLAPRLLLILAATGTVACAGNRPVRPQVAPAAWLDVTGFADRAGWPSTVLHLSREELDFPRERLSSLIIEANLPGIRVTRAHSGGWGIQEALVDDQPGCELGVFLNGSRIQRRRSFVGTLDDLVRPHELDGLEIHLGPEGPVLDPCGAVLLWTWARADAADPPFHGWITGEVTGPGADSVVAVRIDPLGIRLALTDDRTFASAALPPGLYEVAYLTAGGPLSMRRARVFAHQETSLELDVGGRP